jgi:ribosomal 50S subunit-recycling heat shock protein
VNVTSDVTLKKKGESITASDISVGDIVKLKYDGNNKLVQIKVSSKHKHTKPSQEKQTSDTSKSDSSDTSSKA